MAKIMKTRTENLPVSTKKQKFVGIKEFLDPETGEIFPLQVNQVEDRDFNFHKVWLKMFINSLEDIANKKIVLAFWIVDHLNKENQLIYTFRRMAEETGLSINTVIQTMKKLQEGDTPFLRKIQSGVYVVNPEILYKGSHKSRMGVIYEFGTLQNPALNTPKTPVEDFQTIKQAEIPKKVENATEGKLELPTLTGTDKQIRWANEIRGEYYREFCEQQQLFEDAEGKAKTIKMFKTQTTAKFWIEKRKNEK